MTREAIAAVLNRLPFVRWDRLVDAPTTSGDHHVTSVYGWIARADCRSDFVLLEFASWDDTPGFATSSAERSAEIAELLYGAGGPHYPCQRVEDVFGDLVANKVALQAVAE